MAKSSSSPDEDTSINKKNRHQFYETAIASSASDADREIRRAETRGRERALREVELRRSIKRVVWRVVASLVVGLGVLVWVVARRS